jgi:hypothetical protein
MHNLEKCVDFRGSKVPEWQKDVRKIKRLLFENIH